MEIWLNGMVNFHLGKILMAYVIPRLEFIYIIPKFLFKFELTSYDKTIEANFKNWIFKQNA